jgi:diguanylate cyclase (GGDEF)-like protein
LEKAIAEALETNEAMSLMLTDIDHFKTFNDNFGHLTGDQVLRGRAHPPGSDGQRINETLDR